MNRDRPKEVKCPRVVVETYKDEKTGDQKKRSYVRGRPLGKGGFAVVYSMQDPSTGESFAAKARLYSRRSHYATLRARRAPFLKKTDFFVRVCCRICICCSLPKFARYATSLHLITR